MRKAQRAKRAIRGAKLDEVISRTDEEQRRIKRKQQLEDVSYAAPYHERQQGYKCQQHGINNAIGGSILSTKNIEAFRKRLLRKAGENREKLKAVGVPAPKVNSGAHGGPSGMWSRSVILTAASQRGLHIRRCRLGKDGKHPKFIECLSEYISTHPSTQLLLYVDYELKKLDKRGQATLQGVSHCVALRDGHIIDSELSTPVPWKNYYLLRYVTTVYTLSPSRSVPMPVLDRQEDVDSVVCARPSQQERTNSRAILRGSQ